MRARLALWGVALAALLAAPAAACPGCLSYGESNRLAFLGTTVLLSLLPLAMVGGGLLWLRRRSKSLGSTNQNDSPY